VKNMTTSPHRIATHEAGHVGAALQFGIPIIRVTIDAATPHLHRGHYRALHGVALEAMCILCLSGPAAEEYLVGPITDDSDHIDIEMARGYLARRFDVVQIGVELGRARTAARRLVRDQQQRIRLIATALLERGTMTGEDIAGITSGTG
jgi:hypothetical protein